LNDAGIGFDGERVPHSAQHVNPFGKGPYE